MKKSGNRITTKRGLLALRARRGVTCAALAFAITNISACVEKVQHSTQYVDEGDNRVVSGNSRRDASAFQSSEDQLSQVKWSVIERKGPKTAAEQFGFKQYKSSEGAPNDKTSGKGESPRPGPVVTHEYMRITVPMPSTQPTTQPTMQVISVPIVSEEGLPVDVVPLPDGKVRLIWKLRSYGGSSVTAGRDPAGTQRRNVTVAPADLVPLVTVLQQQLGPAGTVLPLPRENTLVVTCDRIMKSSVLDMLSKLDVPPRQVEIAARIFEVSRDFDFQQGARVLMKHLGETGSQNVISTFDTQRLLDSQANGSQFQGSVVSLMKTFEGAGINVETSFQLLADAGLLRVVSSPRMTVAAGQTGYMLAGQELPIQNATVSANVLQTTTQYKPVGVQLYITPQAIGANRVKLHAISIVSSVSGFAPLPTLTGGTSAQALINPVIESREAETAVTVDDGSTLVISGLRMIRTTTRENKVPGLGDLPLLGWLFKNHRSQQQLTDLYFFVTPTLLDGEETASAS
ncbi:MAG: type II secretion system protein GspD [Bacillota bacterium]